MNQSVPDCLFCTIGSSRMILENELAFAMRDGFPVTALHTLVIPKRHESDYFQLTEQEIIACNQLLSQARADIMREDPSVDGFNVGVNVGPCAGQTVFHCHLHLIPRRIGDVPKPKGGVRHIFPEKGFY